MLVTCVYIKPTDKAYFEDLPFDLNKSYLFKSSSKYYGWVLLDAYPNCPHPSYHVKWNNSKKIWVLMDDRAKCYFKELNEIRNDKIDIICN